MYYFLSFFPSFLLKSIVCFVFLLWKIRTWPIPTHFPPNRLSRGAAQHLVTLQGCGIYIVMVAEFLVLRVSPLVFPLPPLALLVSCVSLAWCSLTLFPASGSPRALAAAVRCWEPLVLTACSASQGPCILEPPAPLRLCCFLPLLSSFTLWSCLGRVRRWAASQKQATLSTRTGPFEGMGWGIVAEGEGLVERRQRRPGPQIPSIKTKPAKDRLYSPSS